MISLKDYIIQMNINEEDVSKNEFITVNDLTVSFNAKGPVILEVAKDFNIDDTLIYLDDVALNKMPMKDESVLDLIGKNKEYISDVYFGYSQYAVDKYSDNVTIKWDSKVANVNSDELVYYRFRDLTYNIKFSKFEFMNVSEEELLDRLYSTFSGMLDNHDYIIPLELKKENIKFVK